MRTFLAAPKAAILIESMRDIGYSLETALADLVDNAIVADARTIKLFADTSSILPSIGILDDGAGMSETDLLEAMRPGSKSPLEARPASDLGRFGLGLKTASFSQCRKLTVVTRNCGITSAAIWDLDFVSKADDWLVQLPDDLNSIRWADELGETGTLVIWEKLDRIVDNVDGEKARETFVRKMNDAREHLELVFHRYLSGEQGLRKIRIMLNERPLEPFDPFRSDCPATDARSAETIKVGEHRVVIQAFTLPHHSKVSASDWDRYAGRAGYVKNQGFYLYRERRLIIYGTWFGLARQIELTKLARVRIDINNGLDSEWKIDVKKSSAQPPYQVRERLKRIIEAIGAGSKRIYKSRGRKLTTESRLPVWQRVQNKSEIIYKLNVDHPVIADFAEHLPGELKSSFSRILELLGSTLPMDALFADMAGSPEQVAGNATSTETLLYSVTTTVQLLKGEGANWPDIYDVLRHAEPFRSNWQITETMLQSIRDKENEVDVCQP